MWPWDWVIAAGNAISGVGQKVADWVSSIIASVTGWVSSSINAIWTWGANLVSWIKTIWDQLERFIISVGQQFADAISHLAQNFTGWVQGIWNDLWKYAKGIYDWALSEFGRIINLAEGLVADAVKWVKQEVWDPLVRFYNDLKQWSTQWINQIWQYIQHPELLVQLVGAFLLRMWLQYVIRFGGVLARWLLRNMMGMAGEVFDVLESILSNLL